MEPRERRSILPLRFMGSVKDRMAPVDTSCIPNKCIWKCGAACYHEAPNEAAATARGNAFADVMARRFGRRTLLKGAAAAAVPLVVSSTPVGRGLLGDSPLAPRRAEAAVSGTGLGFQPIALTDQDIELLPPGYTRQVLLRWGDPLFPGVERLTIDNVSPELQQQTFGYNCDLNLWFGAGEPGGPRGAGGQAPAGTRGILWVNHEYTEGGRMFPEYDPEHPTREQVDTELAAHGGTVVELERRDSGWGVVLASPLNRRIDALTTEIEITGPLRGEPRLRTSADPSGRTVVGMLNNCGGGKTPWGTVLTAEENFHQYFANNDQNPDPEQQAANERYGVGGGASQRSWEQHHDRFDLSKEPNEINRFGYIVEVDPADPRSTPKKRTAMGRFKHEAATYSIADDGRVAFYSGDDERFDYLYKFVTRRAWNPRLRKANGNLLNDGGLYVARFDDDGTGEWILLDPATPGLEGWSLADILLYTRLAGDAVGATPMDRPEDVEVNPRNHRVYVTLTNNTARTAQQLNGPNPRANNGAGHIVELNEDGGDAAATRFTWDMFMLCGDPSDPSTFFAGYDRTEVSPIAAPDNITFDSVGNLWISTDGQRRPIGKNDALLAVPTAGPDRGRLQAFYSAPTGAEVTGPEFTGDFTTVFVNIQHPGENSEGPEDPETLWPDGVWPPLPSVIAITKDDGGRIGT